ncbi:polysaccharide pyruvyl transferase CsaB [[Clostridium] colinum]|uniref:polysaccharide pyruvyl transferase CsaB n=1 Tax=[Clostridium] colinum TaxID=36835 RepID=UPI002025869B|nr:polysaccharide pyruvyl transferase CsaB [[Clostridium] colinum]
MINLLIAGYHGYGNCGDEATLMAMTTNIKEMAPDVNITAISHIPELTKTEYNINSVQRFNAIEVIKAIFKSDIILSGGGTLIQNGTSTRSLLYYLSIIKVAKLFKKKVMLYSNGIGPVNGNINRKLVKMVVNNVDLITLREEFSKNDLLDMGVKKPEIHITADAAFTLKSISDKSAINFLIKEKIPLDKDIIGVSVRNWSKAKYGDKYIKEIAKACDNMVKQDKTVLFIPMEQPKDIETSKKVMYEMKQDSYILQQSYKPDEILGIIGQTKLILGMRLHTLLFSASKKVPMIGLVYDPKIEYYLDVLNMPNGGDIRTGDIDAKKLTAQMEGMFMGLERYENILAEKINILLDKAKQNEILLNKELNKIRNKKK